MNRGIATALAAIGIAQLLKIPLNRRKKGKWDFSSIIKTGGMPSSHSAGVASLATHIALKRGIPTIDFALSTIFGLIVMYDAMGVRRQAGELAIQVNQLKENVEKLAGEHPGVYHKKKEKKIKERLGHQPEEVIGGAILGVIVGALSYLMKPEKQSSKIFG